MLSADELAAITASVAIEIAAGLPGGERPYGRGTFRHDNPGFAREMPPQARKLGGNSRPQQAGLARFASTPSVEPVSRSNAGLDPRHPALREGRTIYRSRVFDAAVRDRVLISGINNSKIGVRVTKGPWAKMPIFTLSLEERATCPRSCAVYSECYGNGMPMAVRFKHTPSLIQKLDAELRHWAATYPKGFVVRLHVLGDFPDLAYFDRWQTWSDEIAPLHVWGYTAHPRDSEIGNAIRTLNDLRSDRWAIRFSVAPEAPHAPMQAAAIWTKPATFDRDDDAIVCPQELGRTRTCGTCGLCWNPEAAHLRILFLGHGGRGPRELAA
jgi:hypothetical protein